MALQHLHARVVNAYLQTSLAKYAKTIADTLQAFGHYTGLSGAPVVPSSWLMLTHASRTETSDNLEPTTMASRATKYLRLDWPPCPSPPLHDGSTCIVRNALICQLSE